MERTFEGDLSNILFMKILIIGGTQFFGRHLVSKARELGHELTLFNRGRTNPSAFPGIETIVGDRVIDIKKLAGRSWDAVIDTCGYFPSQLRASASQLKNATAHYVYISSMSVYDNPGPNENEDGPTYKLSEGINPENPDDATYGLRKKLCEEEVEAIMPGRVLHVRPSLIVGPYDTTWRYAYWLDRVKRGGEICAPESPDLQIRYIDVEDLADWILNALPSRRTGVFNLLGPAENHTFGDFLNEAIALLNPSSKLIWMSKEFLDREEVGAWDDLPIWLPPEYSNLHLLSFQKAKSAGLRFSSPRETILKTMKWMESGINLPAKSGLDFQKEKMLIEKWKSAHLMS